MIFEKTLQGIDAIAEFLKLLSAVTVLDWRLSYGLPILKIRGTWVASKAELREWMRQHPELAEPRMTIREPKPKKIIKRPKRW